MKINMNDVNKMIKEEFQRMWDKRALLKKLEKVNEAIENLGGTINEVEAGGKTTVASSAWTGEPNGDEKFKPKFEKIGTHLKEEETENDITNSGSDMGLEVGDSSMGGSEDGMPAIGGAPAEENPMGEFEAKFAAIGKAIDTKLASEMGGAAPVMGGAPDADADKGADMEFDDVVTVDGDDKPADVSTGEAGPADSEKEEVDEVVTVVKEDAETPIEGHSVAQEAKTDTVNDNMEKTNHVKESVENNAKVITEAKKPANKDIFLEGHDEAGKAQILAERKRMLKFAGLKSDEDEE